jgi:hypothetical protein
MTELVWLKEAIEDGDSCIEAYEQVDIDQMRQDGNDSVADKIEQVLALVGEINTLAGISYHNI